MVEFSVILKLHDIRWETGQVNGHTICLQLITLLQVPGFNVSETWDLHLFYYLITIFTKPHLSFIRDLLFLKRKCEFKKFIFSVNSHEFRFDICTNINIPED